MNFHLLILVLLAAQASLTNKPEGVNVSKRAESQNAAIAPNTVKTLQLTWNISYTQTNATSYDIWQTTNLNHLAGWSYLVTNLSSLQSSYSWQQEMTLNSTLYFLIKSNP